MVGGTLQAASNHHSLAKTSCSISSQADRPASVSPVSLHSAAPKLAFDVGFASGLRHVNYGKFSQPGIPSPKAIRCERPHTNNWLVGQACVDAHVPVKKGTIRKASYTRSTNQVRGWNMRSAKLGQMQCQYEGQQRTEPSDLSSASSHHDQSLLASFFCGFPMSLVVGNVWASKMSVFQSFIIA